MIPMTPRGTRRLLDDKTVWTGEGIQTPLRPDREAQRPGAALLPCQKSASASGRAGQAALPACCGCVRLPDPLHFLQECHACVRYQTSLPLSDSALFLESVIIARQGCSEAAFACFPISFRSAIYRGSLLYRRSVTIKSMLISCGFCPSSISNSWQEKQSPTR